LPIECASQPQLVAWRQERRAALQNIRNKLTLLYKPTKIDKSSCWIREKQKLQKPSCR